MNEKEYSFLKRKILNLTRIDLDSYKSQQMHRRLSGFITSQGEDVIHYCRLLERDQNALRKLQSFLTINVSEFFRDPDQFEELKSRVLREPSRHNSRLDIWCAGCSHGAEPYSIAMTLEKMDPRPSHRILATDIDTDILKRAREGGPYSASDVKNVESQLLQKYFTESEQRYFVTLRIRRKVEFKKHNLLSDPFESNFDLIVCRNVVIYFSDEAKERLMVKFHHSLKPGGVLFVGATEALLNASKVGFERLCNSFYRKSVYSPLPRTRVVAAPSTSRV